MRLTVNGEPKTLKAQTVRELVEELGLGRQPVAVELNKQVVPRRAHESTPLHEEDVVELVTLVGGG